MKTLTYIVIHTGKRTWQVATFDQLSSILTPLFTMLPDKFKTIDAAMADCQSRQDAYEKCTCKVVRELAYDPIASNCTKPIKASAYYFGTDKPV